MGVNASLFFRISLCVAGVERCSFAMRCFFWMDLQLRTIDHHWSIPFNSRFAPSNSVQLSFVSALVRGFSCVVVFARNIANGIFTMICIKSALAKVFARIFLISMIREIAVCEKPYRFFIDAVLSSVMAQIRYSLHSWYFATELLARLMILSICTVVDSRLVCDLLGHNIKASLRVTVSWSMWRRLAVYDGSHDSSLQKCSW